MTSYFAVLAAFAAFLGTWTDEEYTLATTAHGLGYAWRRAIDYELQAPLYFAVMALWREANASVYFARLFSVAAASAFLYAMLRICARVAPGRPPLWPALWIALNPFVIYAAFDIRLYAPALLLSALSWLAFDAGFGSGRDFRARACFVAVSIVSLYTQYFLGFALVGYAAALVAAGRFRALPAYAGALVPIALATIPLLGIVRSQIGGSGETGASAAALLRLTLVHPWLEFVLPYERTWDLMHVRKLYIAAVAVLAALAAWGRPWQSRTLRGAFACAATIEMLFVVVVLVFRLDLDTRHYVVLFVPALVAGYALVTTLESGPFAPAGKLLAGSYVLLTAAVLYGAHHDVAQSGDSKRVAAYLEEHAAPNAVVAVFPADALPAYARQYRGAAKLVPFPEALPSKSYDIADIDVKGEGEVLAALAKLRAAPQVWLVMLGACETGQAYGCDRVLAAVADASRVVSQRRFYDSRVFQLDVRVARAASPERRSSARP